MTDLASAIKAEEARRVERWTERLQKKVAKIHADFGRFPTVAELAEILERIKEA